MRMLLRIIIIVLLASACSQTRAQIETVGEFLDALEEADDSISTLTADILYERFFALAGDEQTRFGKLYFETLRREAGSDRRFAIHFETLVIGQRVEQRPQTYIFDGEWLIERHPHERLFIKRQIAPPDSKFDPLQLGEGPLPIPIGQRRADIESRYIATLRERTEGLELTDKPEELSAFVEECHQLHLVPRPERVDIDDFQEIRLWYRKDSLLPVMARTVNRQGDESLVRLTRVRTNDEAVIPPEKLTTETPESGWDIDIQPWRGRTGARAPRPTGTTIGFNSQPHPAQDADDLGVKLSPRVVELLDSTYLDASETRRLRVFHGVWTDEDLHTPQLRASAALIRGAIDDDALHDARANAEDRAQAMLLRGELQEALQALEDQHSVRAVRIRVETLEQLGRMEDAGLAIEPLIERLTRTAADADEIVEGARALNIRLRLKGQERAGGEDFRSLMALLAQAREMDQLHWPAHLAEARILYERDNWAQAREALLQALALNPRSGDAWALLGRMSVEGFDFDSAETIADRLDQLASGDSVRARMIRARVRLRQRDAQGALDQIAPVLERHPEMREALALEVAAAGGAYDFDRMNELLDAFDQRSPGSPLALFETGRVLAEARQYEAAADLLEQASRRQPFWAHPVIELGLLEVQSGRDGRALKALREAAALDPFNVRADNSLTLIEELISYHEVESEHFVVRFKPGTDGLLAAEMLEPLEASYARVTGAGDGGIDYEPPVRTRIDLMPDHRWFGVRIAGMPQIHTMAASTGPVIAMESPRVGRNHKVGTYDWDRVLRHEFVHTVTLSRTRNRIPHWFTEASAVHLEDAPRNESRCRLLADALRNDALFDLDEINIAFVRPKTPTGRSLAYGQGHWMYEYIIERSGSQAPLDLMDLYATGLREHEAFEQVLGVTIETFLDEFKEWARDQVVAWGLAPTPGTPTILELLTQEAQRMRAEAGEEGGDGEMDLPEPTPRLVQQWLAEYPDHPDVLELALSGALAGGDLDGPTIELLHRYSRVRPVAALPHRIMAQHHLAGNDGGPIGAAPHLEFLDVREQHSPVYASQLADIYANAGKLDEASAKITRAIRIAPFDADLREQAARIALLRRDLDEAEYQLTALFTLEPDRDVHQKRLEALRRMKEGRG